MSEYKESDENEDMAGDIGADPTFESDPDKDLRDLMPDVKTDGGIEFKQPDEIPIEDVPMEELKQIRLSRKRTVMKFVENDTEYAYFSDVNEDTGVHQTAYTMSKYDFEAFGSPEFITVGVVNGDILNG